MSDTQIKQISADLERILSNLEQTTASTLSQDSQVLAADIKELITIYPKAKPFIQDALPLLRALPFKWAKPVANVITLMMRIIDDVITDTSAGATAS